MTAEALRAYLHLHIPLSQAMEVAVIEASPQHVLLEAPLAPNINMHGTMFGGSAATLALLAAWAVLHLKLQAEGLNCQLVVHRTHVDYLLPIKGCVRASARLDETQWPGFRHAFDRSGRARLTMVSELLYNGQVAARLSGEFVALAET